MDEDNVEFDGMPDDLWTDFSNSHWCITTWPTVLTKLRQNVWKNTQVLIEEKLYEGDPVTAKLTTKHVHDWRLKPYGDVKIGLQ